MKNESDLIHFFKQQAQAHSKFIHTSIGDDAAILDIPQNHQLVSSIDTSISGVHFPPETDPADIAYKSLAVSMSDMAAMGAEPIGILLALTVPALNEAWIKAFAKGFFECANEFKVPLIGGDTTQGPLSISTVLHGIVPQNQALLRSGAQVDDLIYVSGQLGNAALALQHWREGKLSDPLLKQALNRPTPRIELGLALRSIATSAIDLSDGLAQDLQRILTASKVGADLELDKLPTTVQRHALNGGDDYELCFTVPQKHQLEIEGIEKTLKLKLSCIGSITKERDLKIYDKEKKIVKLESKGYEHFS